MSYDQTTWSDIAYQERHGHLPDNGSTADELREYFGDPSNGDYDPDDVRDVMRAVGDESMSQRIRALEEENASLREALGEEVDDVTFYDDDDDPDAWRDDYHDEDYR